eukprot:4843895-Pleurochrysis_carterae.AAC.2
MTAKDYDADDAATRVERKAKETATFRHDHKSTRPEILPSRYPYFFVLGRIPYLQNRKYQTHFTARDQISVRCARLLSDTHDGINGGSSDP